MSAVVLRFTGDWKGWVEPATAEMEARENALHDARQIIAAKRAEDSWTATVLTGMLAAMDKPHLLRLELAIGTHGECNDATRQALALVRLGNCGKDHRRRVKSAIDALQAGRA